MPELTPPILNDLTLNKALQDIYSQINNILNNSVVPISMGKDVYAIRAKIDGKTILSPAKLELTEFGDKKTPSIDNSGILKAEGFKTGKTTITSNEYDVSSGDFLLDVAGNIQLNADGGTVTIRDDSRLHFTFDCDNTKFSIFDDTQTLDLFRIVVDTDGATTIATVDTDGTSGDLTVDADGDIELNADGGQVTIKDGTDSHFLFDCDATRLTIYDDTSAADYLRFTVAANGASTIETLDGDGTVGHLKIAPDGNLIALIGDADESSQSFHVSIDGANNRMCSIFGEADSYSSLRLYEFGGQSTSDYFEIKVEEEGATTISTIDAAASAANLTMYPDGDLTLRSVGDISIRPTGVTYLESTLRMKETASAGPDVSTYGQIWVKNENPNELWFTAEDGTDIQITSDSAPAIKYEYETKFIGYYSNATTAYLPMTGYVVEGSSATSRNEYQGFCAPYNGTIEKVTFRSEVAQDGNLSFRVLEATDGTEIPGTMIFRKETVVDIADDIYQELDMTSPSTGSNYSPLTKGRIYQLYLGTASNPYDTNITIVFKWDVTT